VPKQYLAASRDLDQKFYNSQRGEVGPIEAKLLEFGTRDGPKPHAVVGFVLGAFGELSNSCYSLCTVIARVDAARVVSFWEISPKNAFALCKQKPLRFWVLLRNAAGLASSWTAFKTWCSSPAIPRPPRASQTLFRMSTIFFLSRHWAWNR
jgi:hypothetical protein